MPYNLMNDNALKHDMPNFKIHFSKFFIKISNTKCEGYSNALFKCDAQFIQMHYSNVMPNLFKCEGYSNAL
jgi:hypothetical protein